MKFKKRNDKCRTASIEIPKLKEKHKEFFVQIQQELSVQKYTEWEEEALFFLFLKPEMDINQIRPENLENYIKSAISINGHQLI